MYKLSAPPNLSNPPRVKQHLTKLGASTEDKRGKGGTRLGEKKGMKIKKGRSDWNNQPHPSWSSWVADPDPNSIRPFRKRTVSCFLFSWSVPCLLHVDTILFLKAAFNSYWCCPDTKTCVVILTCIPQPGVLHSAVYRQSSSETKGDLVTQSFNIQKEIHKKFQMGKYLQVLACILHIWSDYTYCGSTCNYIFIPALDSHSETLTCL